MEKKCTQCATVLTKSKATSALGVFSAMKEPVKYFTKEESSELHPYVCSNCGLTQWYVDEPQKFIN